MGQCRKVSRHRGCLQTAHTLRQGDRLSLSLGTGHIGTGHCKALSPALTPANLQYEPRCRGCNQTSPITLGTPTAQLMTNQCRLTTNRRWPIINRWRLTTNRETRRLGSP